MRKFFTFVILALVAVSVWGAEVSVTIPESGTMTTPDFPFCITRGSSPIVKVYQSKTQQIYLASEIGSTNAGTIKSISFKSSTYATTHSDFSDTRRKLTVYMQETELPSLSSFVDYSEASQIFSIDNFEITSGASFSFNNFEFNWDGTKNILITIIDLSQNNTASQGGKTFFGYTPSTTGRGIAQTFNYDGSASAPYSTPTPLNTIAQVTFTIDASGSTTPSISTSTDALNFGSFYPAGETVSKTFTVSASNLTENISLSTTAAGVTINPSTINKGEDGSVTDAEVTVTLGAEYEFKAGTKITLSSGTDVSQDVSLSATQITDDNFVVPTAINFVNNVGTYYNISNATIKTIDENSMSFNNATSFTADYSAIAGQQTYSASGKFTNLKGKLVAADRFVIFSFGTYTGPSKPTITLDENIDNTTAIEALADGTDISSITIKRTFAVNEWNTIILPVEIESGDIINMFGDDAQVMAFDNAEVSSSRITLNFKSANSMSAGTPYLVKPSKEVDNPKTLQNREFYQSTSTVTKNGIEFVGVLVPTAMDAEGDDYIFVGANNTLFHPEGAGTIKGMRAYFHVVGETAKAAIKKSPMISLSTGSTTAMTLVKPDAGKAYKAIENGRIVIKANGKKVNVLGQTVK